MVKDIAFSSFPAKDVRALREFYTDALGIRFADPYVEEGVEKYAEAQVGNGWFAVLSNQWVDVAPSGGIAFEVDDIEKTLEKIRSRGGSDFEDVHPLPTCKITSFRDPEGNEVTLHQSTA